MSDHSCEHSGHTWDYRSAVEVDEIPCADCDAVKSALTEGPESYDPYYDNCGWCGDETDFCGHEPYAGGGVAPKRNPTPWNSSLMDDDRKRRTLETIPHEESETL